MFIIWHGHTGRLCLDKLHGIAFFLFKILQPLTKCVFSFTCFVVNFWLFRQIGHKTISSKHTTSKWRHINVSAKSKCRAMSVLLHDVALTRWVCSNSGLPQSRFTSINMLLDCSGQAHNVKMTSYDVIFTYDVTLSSTRRHFTLYALDLFSLGKANL